MMNMIVNLDMYRCNNCKEILEFDTSVEYERKCTKCGSTNLRFSINYDADTDLIDKKVQATSAIACDGIILFNFLDNC